MLRIMSELLLDEDPTDALPRARYKGTVNVDCACGVGAVGAGIGVEGR